MNCSVCGQSMAAICVECRSGAVEKDSEKSVNAETTSSLSEVRVENTDQSDADRLRALMEALLDFKHMDLRDGSPCWCRNGFGYATKALQYHFEPNGTMIHSDACAKMRLLVSQPPASAAELAIAARERAREVVRAWENELHSTRDHNASHNDLVERIADALNSAKQSAIEAVELLRATRQILAEYESDDVLQIQAKAIDKFLASLPIGR